MHHDKKDDRALGEKVRKLRLLNGLTAVALCDAMGIGATTGGKSSMISAIEKGNMGPSLREIAQNIVAHFEEGPALPQPPQPTSPNITLGAIVDRAYQKLEDLRNAFLPLPNHLQPIAIDTVMRMAGLNSIQAEALFSRKTPPSPPKPEPKALAPHAAKALKVHRKKKSFDGWEEGRERLISAIKASGYTYQQLYELLKIKSFGHFLRGQCRKETLEAMVQKITELPRVEKRAGSNE